MLCNVKKLITVQHYANQHNVKKLITAQHYANQHNVKKLITAQHYANQLCNTLKKIINYCAISTIIFHVGWRSKCLNRNISASTSPIPAILDLFESP